MPGPIIYTPRLHLAKLPENYHVWASIMNSNLAMLDAAISSIYTYTITGVWTNSTHYTVGNVVLDPDTAVLWRNDVDHYSMTLPSTFADERAAFPTYWESYIPPAHARGVWTGPGTSYAVNDFVMHGTQYAMCIKPHVSSSDFNADVLAGDWQILFDVGNQILPITSAGDANKVLAVNAAGSGYTLVQNTVDTLAQLKAITSTYPQFVFMRGFAAVNDGGGGLMMWMATSTVAPDEGLVFQPASMPATGRWFRFFSGNPHCRFWGAGVEPLVPGTPEDHTAKLLAALTSAVPTHSYTLDCDNCILNYGTLTLPDTSKCVGMRGYGSGIIQPRPLYTINDTGITVAKPDFTVDGFTINHPIFLDSQSPVPGLRAFYFRYDGGPAKHWVYSNNNHIGSGSACSMASNGIGGSADDNRITDNFIYWTFGDAIGGYDMSRCIVSRNIIYASGHGGPANSSASGNIRMNVSFNRVVDQDYIISDNICVDANLSLDQECIDCSGAQSMGLRLSGNILDNGGSGGFEIKSFVAGSQFTGTMVGTALTITPPILYGNTLEPPAIGMTVYGTGMTPTKIVSGSGLNWVMDTSQNVGPITMNCVYVYPDVYKDYLIEGNLIRLNPNAAYGMHLHVTTGAGGQLEPDPTKLRQARISNNHIMSANPDVASVGMYGIYVSGWNDIDINSNTCFDVDRPIYVDASGAFQYTNYRKTKGISIISNRCVGREASIAWVWSDTDDLHIMGNHALTTNGTANCLGLTGGGGFPSQVTGTFTGTINGTAMTVSGVTGTLTKGQYISGVGVTPGTRIIAGVAPNWIVDTSQTVGPVSMSACLTTSFTGTIAGTTLTVTAGPTSGFIAPGMNITGGSYPNWADYGTKILSGSGATWTLDRPSTVASPTVFTGGTLVTGGIITRPRVMFNSFTSIGGAALDLRNIKQGLVMNNYCKGQLANIVTRGSAGQIGPPGATDQNDVDGLRFERNYIEVVNAAAFQFNSGKNISVFLNTIILASTFRGWISGTPGPDTNTLKYAQNYRNFLLATAGDTIPPNVAATQGDLFPMCALSPAGVWMYVCTATGNAGSATFKTISNS